MLLEAENSMLILMDMQSSMVNRLHHATSTAACCQWLLQAAKHCKVPMVITEQRAQGHTLNLLKQAAGGASIVEHQGFNAADELSPCNLKPQLILCGAQAHLSLLQTALQLKSAGKSVFLVADAISSIQAGDKNLALNRAHHAGIIAVNREMVVGEWLPQPAMANLLLQRAPQLNFNEVLSTLPTVQHLAALQLWRDGKLESVIENNNKQLGALTVYHALMQEFGAITPKAARLGQWLYAEKANEARNHPGKYPHIDRLFALEAIGGGYGVRLIAKNNEPG